MHELDTPICYLILLHTSATPFARFVRPSRLLVIAMTLHTRTAAHHTNGNFRATHMLTAIAARMVDTKCPDRERKLARHLAHSARRTEVYWLTQWFGFWASVDIRFGHRKSWLHLSKREQEQNQNPDKDQD